MFWMRVVELIAGGRSFNGDDFEIDFKVLFSTSEDPDVSEVMIYNLTDSTIQSIESKAIIILNAGYKGKGTPNILTGKIETVDTKWQGVDKITTIKASDGGFEWRKPRIQKSYAKGTTSTAIMQDLISVAGLGIGDLSPPKTITYKLGRNVSGHVDVLLREFARDTGSKMYIDKGQIFIRDNDKPSALAYVLNKDTGLIDSPEKCEEEDSKGNKIIKYKVKSLLQGTITTDSLVQIESRKVNGTFRVVKGTHTGDFITEIEVV